MMSQGPFLLIVTQEGNRQTFRFDQDRVTIGRSRQCDLCLPARVVSRSHCYVERDGEKFFVVQDAGQNPVMLRGVPVDRAEIEVGDSFSISKIDVELAMPKVESVSIDETYLGDPVQSAKDLATLIKIGRALNSEHDTTRLLTLIVDSAIKLLGAERGFLLLGSGDQPMVEVARNFAEEEVLSPEYNFSRTIATRVRESGVPELTINAQEDARFRDLASVEDLRLRSVLCIPIRIRETLVGVLYVDNRLQQQAFHQRELELLTALGDHAGVAISNARTMEELRAKHIELQDALARVGQLNASLKGQVATQKAELGEMRQELSDTMRGGRFAFDYSEIVGESRRMVEVFKLLDKFIGAEDPVLILGESGTGKELIARAIHANGSRKQRPFVTENCAAMPSSLLESELFGYVKGAFTGATADKRGLFETANGGVLFLDEIGDMPTELQKKLLRVLQEGEVRPVGSQRVIKVDFRLVTATNRNLDEMMKEGEFREDLFYRLTVLPVQLPPLRERRQDVPLMVRRFLAGLAKENDTLVRISPDAMDALAEYRWPGNVRELQNEVRRAALLCDGVILVSHLSRSVTEPQPEFDDLVPAEKGTNLPDMVRDLEMRLIGQAYRLANGNKSRSAEMLGISRFALQRKLEKYDIQDEASGSEESTADDDASTGVDSEVDTDASPAKGRQP
ncbi:MAG: sigma 54-interacting transcriptional regulator [Planctomycetota bacterium]|nr:sigma 54-interacting transcriptional regulator [Planctomycetota bacterium]